MVISKEVLAHPSYGAAVDEITQGLASLMEQRASSAEQKSAKSTELAALEAQLPAMRQAQRSRQVTLFDVKSFESQIRGARREVLVLRKALKECDMAIEARRAALSTAGLAALPPALAEQEARRAALFAQEELAKRALRSIPGDIGQLDLAIDSLDAEERDALSSTAAMAEAMEARRIAYST